MSDLDADDLVSIFRQQLGDFFIPFEVEIHFHLEKLIRASVALNRAEVANRLAFPFQCNARIITGLFRSNKDCQVSAILMLKGLSTSYIIHVCMHSKDTEAELTKMWIHEVRRTYCDRLRASGGSIESMYEFEDFVNAHLNETISPTAAKTWAVQSAGPDLYGDFVNVHGFYTEIGSEAAMRHVRTSIDRLRKGEKVAGETEETPAPSPPDPKKELQFQRQLAEFGLTQNKVVLFCRLQRILTMEQGHLVRSNEML